MQDKEYMSLAISLARATKGQTSPNPQVGAVLVKDGRIIGTGAHLQAGTPHAEVHAIQEAEGQTIGSDLYVTLEPCSHTGKTPPCSDEIIKAGIKRVFMANADPNPLVSGKGIAKLKQAGIEVETGMLKEEAAEVNASFFHFIQTNQPYVTIKAAVSIDGKIATKTGDSKWITSPGSRQDVHRLRHEHDAILTGIHTIIQDNPQLTTRLPRGGKHPIRVILDTHLSMPSNAKVVTDEMSHTIIYTGSDIDQLKAASLQSNLVEIVPLSFSTIKVTDVLQDLGHRKITSVLVEGGSEIHASFTETNNFQEIILYMAPKIIGGKNAISFISGKGPDFIKEAAELDFTQIDKIGSDIKITAKPRRKDNVDVHRNC